VAYIINAVTDAEHMGHLPISTTRMLHTIHLVWTNHNLLPKDDLADNMLTLLDIADNWLAESA
jgi:hypothetical protein